MRSEIAGSSGERPTVNKAVGGFSVFLATRISQPICASQVSSYIVRPVHVSLSIEMNFLKERVVRETINRKI
jgi:hypothetical protein